MNTLYKTCLIIATVGCLNWGLVGILNFNLVEFLFGNSTIITRLVYIIVAISGIIQLGILSKDLYQQNFHLPRSPFMQLS